MTTPNPSKAQEWWQQEPYLKSYKCEEYETGQEVWDFRYDIPAIIRESQRLLLERATREIKELRWYKSDIPHSPKAAYHEAFKDILKHLSSLTNGDVENPHPPADT